MLESDLILSLTRDARVDFPRMGANKLRIYLKPKFEKMGIDIGRDAYASLLADNHMLVHRKRSKRKTTFSHHRFYKYPNLIRDYTPTAPNQLWVSDITYVEVGYGFIYLSLITDACSRKIMGWDLSRDLSSAGTLRALKKALSALPADSSLIHHSDRGTQYCCTEYVKILEKRGCLISMTESGDPLENAIAERVNGILKNEWLDGQRLKSWDDALSYVEKIIDLYNNERPHQSISFLTPGMVHVSGIHVERKWKNYYSQKPPLPNPSPRIPSQVISGHMQESVKPCR
jgi:transposase InsO family protein